MEQNAPDCYQIFDDIIYNISRAKEFVLLVDTGASKKQFNRIGISNDKIHYYVGKYNLFREFIEHGTVAIPKPKFESPYAHAYFTSDVSDVSDSEDFQKRLIPNGLSIILPSYNRLKNIKRSLHSIIAQSPPPVPVQLIVINDGSSDGTKEYLEALSFPSWIDVEIFHLENKTAWSSPSIAYNFGFTKVKWNYVIHHGVDMVFLDPNCLCALYKHAEIDRYLYFMMNIIEEKFIENIPLNNYFFQSANRNSCQTISTPYPFIAITSFDALSRIGFYSEGYASGPGEDDELLTKLSLINCKFVRIIDHGIAHQEHTKNCKNICNKDVKDAGCELLIKKIEDKTIERYLWET